MCVAARGFLMKLGVCQRQGFLILMLILLFFKNLPLSAFSFSKLSKWQSSPRRRAATEDRLSMTLANDTEHWTLIFWQWGIVVVVHCATWRRQSCCWQGRWFWGKDPCGHKVFPFPSEAGESETWLWVKCASPGSRQAGGYNKPNNITLTLKVCR